MSQPSIREATRALEATGLIEARHGSGTYVTGDPTMIIATALQAVLQMQRVGMPEVIGLRTALARYSVERAVEEATAADIELIKEREEELLAVRKVDDLKRAADLAVEFMVSITAAAHQPLLLAIDSFLIRLLVEIHQRSFVDLDAWYEWSLSFAPIRRRLVGSLEARDKKGATAAMISYLELQADQFGQRPASDLRLDTQTMQRLAAPAKAAGSSSSG